MAGLMQGNADDFIKKKRRSSGDQGAIDFSPLCDMTFQLLAFFIMTVQLANQETVAVPRISHGKGVDLETATVFTILTATDPKGDARILLGNGPDGAPVTMEEAKVAIEGSVRQGKKNIIIKAEGTVTAGVVQRVSRLVANVAGTELFIGVADKD